MPQIWSERFDEYKHRDRMREVAALGPGDPDRDNLIQKRVYFVRVCAFTFEFHSICQIRACVEYYSRMVQPSSRCDISPSGHWSHWLSQRWFERLPQYLLEEAKRKRVLAALGRALQQFTLEG